MTDKLNSWLFEGHFRMSAYSPLTKESRILVDRRNTIMTPAALICARGLAGLPNSKISHLYLGYNNNDAYPSGGYTISSSTPGFVQNANTGFLRIPLTFEPSITDGSDDAKLVTFSALVNQPTGFVTTGSPALNSGGANGSDFFEAGLVCQTDPNGSPSNFDDDLLLARIAFERLAYDSAFNLTVSWGIKLSI